jgi:hypothetical protein
VYLLISEVKGVCIFLYICLSHHGPSSAMPGRTDRGLSCLSHLNSISIDFSLIIVCILVIKLNRPRNSFRPVSPLAPCRPGDHLQTAVPRFLLLLSVFSSLLISLFLVQNIRSVSLLFRRSAPHNPNYHQDY